MCDKKFFTHMMIFLASGAYTGFAPFASGTVGTLPGVALYFLLPRDNPSLYLLITCLIYSAGCWVAGQGEIIFGQKDSGKIVIDEIAGYLVSMFALPHHWGWIIGAFFLFRFFDIIKLAPASQCERLSGGIGVMSDDIFAGIYTNLTLQVIYYLFG